jgi:predicted deacylase
MNVAAFERFDPEDPTASRYVDEDFNRVWSADKLDGDRDSVELRRAREVRPIIDQVDYLLDVHSMQHPTVPLMMCGPLDKGRQLALALGAPQHVIADAGHAAGRRMRDYDGFADASSAKNALLIECGQHWEPSSVSVAKDIVLRFLASYAVVDPDFVDTRSDPSSTAEQRVIEVTGPVTINTDAFRFAEDYRGLEIIERAGTVIGWDGDQEVQTPYDRCVLIMPSRRLKQGESAVRFGRYVE